MSIDKGGPIQEVASFSSDLFQRVFLHIKNCPDTMNGTVLSLSFFSEVAQTQRTRSLILSLLFPRYHT